MRPLLAGMALVVAASWWSCGRDPYPFEGPCFGLSCTRYSCPGWETQDEWTTTDWGREEWAEMTTQDSLSWVADAAYCDSLGCCDDL